jgi:hypothetical protein
LAKGPNYYPEKFRNRGDWIMSKIKLVSLVLWSAFFVFGCSEAESQKEATKVEKPAAAISGPLASVVDHLRKEGLTIDDVHPKAYQELGAVDGIGLTVEGGGIEIYLFDPRDEAMVNRLKIARDTGMFLDPNINREVPVVMNGNIMLFGLELFRYKHPARERIAEAFGGM